MLKLDNPAGRLQHLLERGRQENRGDSGVNAWGRLLGASGDDRSELFYLLGRAMGLPARVRDLIEREPDIDPSIYLRWLPTLEAAFGEQALNGQFATFIDRIDPTALYGIEICSDILSKRCPEPLLDDPKLAELGDDVDQLIGSVLSSALPQSIKEVLL